MPTRKPVLLIDDGDDSKKAVELFKQLNIEFIDYNIKKFEESCCGDLPTTKPPSIFAPEGVFKGLDGIKEYISLERMHSNAKIQSESAYW
jgi:hypothetical protein